MTDITITIRGKAKSGKSTVAWDIHEALKSLGYEHVYVKDADEYSKPSYQGERSKVASKKSIRIETQSVNNNVRGEKSELGA